jgi:hypothetical protein
MTFHLLCGSQPHIHIKFHRADTVLISGFCCSAHEVYALLGCYTSLLGVGYLHFGTTYQFHHQGSNTKTLENGTDGLSQNEFHNPLRFRSLLKKFLLNTTLYSLDESYGICKPGKS